MTLKRFSEARQDQVEQLISYATLLGLTGSDLMSIGGKMEREKTKIRKQANMEIIKGFKCLPIGRDIGLGHRFKLKTANGDYNFYNNGWDAFEVVSLRTKVRQTHRVDQWGYDLPKLGDYQTRARCAMLLDIATGKFNLNF